MFGFGERAKMKGPAVVCDLMVLLALPHEPLAPGTQDRLDVWDGALLAGVAALIIPIDVASQSVL